MKKILILSTILVIAITAGVIYYFKWRTDFVKNKVPELVFLKSDSLYQISYDNVYIDEINGEVKIENLHLRPDTTNKKDKDRKLPRSMLEVTIPVLHLVGLHTDDAMMNEQVIARKLLLEKPVVTLYHNHNREEKKLEENIEFTTHSVYRAILRNLSRIKVDSIIISDAHYNMVRWQTGDTILSGTPVNISLFDIDISDSTSADTSRVLFAKRAMVKVDSLSFRAESKLYNYRVSKVEMNSEEKALSIKVASVVPTYSEDGFTKQLDKQQDRFDVDFSGLRFSNIDIDRVLDGTIIADKLTVREAVIKIYRDKNLPRNNVNRVGRYPHQLLQKMPLAVSLKRFEINSGYIEYKERSDKTGNSGKIRFHNISMNISNFTNRPQDLAANPAVGLHLRAKFLNEIPVNINLRLYPGSSNGKFTADGDIAGAEATVFNQLVQPLGMANIESGRMNSCEFHLQGNDYGASGTVTLLYNDLKVKLLEKDPEDGQYKAKKFASFLANAAIKNDNPKKNKAARVAHVNYKRDVNKSFFNLVWKSIMTGIRETVGIEGNEAKTDTR